MVNENFEFLAFGLVTFARQEVPLLSEELLYTRIAGSTLSSLPLLCTLDDSLAASKLHFNRLWAIDANWRHARACAEGR